MYFFDYQHLWLVLVFILKKSSFIKLFSFIQHISIYSFRKICSCITKFIFLKLVLFFLFLPVFSASLSLCSFLSFHSRFWSTHRKVYLLVFYGPLLFYPYLKSFHMIFHSLLIGIWLLSKNVYQKRSACSQ